MKSELQIRIKNKYWKTYRWLTASRRALSDFIIVGVQKGGTSSLFHYLSQHSSIMESRRKEVHYFDSNYHRGLIWYKSFFSWKSKNKIAGEASPYYFFHPHVPERVYNLTPKVKIIVMLRNPIERAFSHYKMEKRNSFEAIPTFEEVIEQEERRTKPEMEKLLIDPLYNSYELLHHTYLSRGKYFEQMKHWLQYFPQEQIMVIRSEDFFRKPIDCLNMACNFLHIPTFIPENLKPINVGHKENLNPATKTKLFEFYKEDNKKLVNLLGEKYNLSKWE